MSNVGAFPNTQQIALNNSLNFEQSSVLEQAAM